MKQIKLESISMIGFRGERERTTTFSPKETTIKGSNGLGKSRHFDAFLWCLFGKDKEDRKDFEVKTRDAENNTTDKAPCEVTVVLNVNGDSITLRRAYVEEWVKPRGQAEEVFKGHHTDCWWNDVPVNVNEFKKRVSSLIEDTTFKLLTNPEYFTSLKWEDQRAILFEIAHAPSLEEIVASSDEWASLMEALKGRSLSDFRKEVSARKKKLKADLEKVQPKIDQTRSLIPDAEDEDSLQAHLEDTEQEIKSVTRASEDVAERIRQAGSASALRQQRIEELKAHQRKLVADEARRADEATYAQGATRRELEQMLDTAKREIADFRKEAERHDNIAQSKLASISEYEAKLEVLRTKWMEVNSSAYNGDTTCPHCRQSLPEDQLDQAKAVWQSAKDANLEKLQNSANEYKEAIEECKADAEANTLKCAEFIAKADKLALELPAIMKALAYTPAGYKVEPRPAEELEGYSELEAEIQELSSVVDTIETDSTEAYRLRRKELEAIRDEIRDTLAKVSLRKEYEAKIANLEAEGKKLAQLIADAEREEYTAAQLSIRKIEECEKRINGLFKHVTFKLFDYTIEDKDKENPTECCVPLIDGVPFTVANTAKQVNAGIEIINALSRFYGVSAPIFIDNRESVQSLIDTDSQIINLVVSSDKELTITHNN
nr:MAG TPA: chromosome partition protein [Caudoviricetes sp.]